MIQQVSNPGIVEADCLSISTIGVLKEVVLNDNVGIGFIDDSIDDHLSRHLNINFLTMTL